MTELEANGATSGEFDPELRAAIENCERADGYLVAAFTHKDGEIRLWRKSSGFPVEELDSLVDLLDDDLRAERSKARGGNG